MIKYRKFYFDIMISGILYRIALIIFILVAMFYDYHILLAVIFSLSVIGLTKKFIYFLNKRYKISLKLIGVFYILCFILFFFLLSKSLVDLFINQNLRLIDMINDQKLIDAKIKKIHIIFNDIKLRLIDVGNNYVNDFYNQKIDQFFTDLPDIIISKAILYLKIFLERSYISGIKFLDFCYTFLISLVFLFYSISDLRKIQNSFYVICGVYSEKILNLFSYIKRVVLVVLYNQIKVSFIMTIIYSVSFYIFGFQYFFLYSLLFSIFTLIPIIGSFFSIVLLLISCYFFEYNFFYSSKLLSILMCGFLIENLILTPKLIGDSTNTHPLIIIFGVILLPQFFGVFGLVFTLPIVAIINSIINNIIYKIKNSEGCVDGAA